MIKDNIGKKGQRRISLSLLQLALGQSFGVPHLTDAILESKVSGQYYLLYSLELGTNITLDNCSFT